MIKKLNILYIVIAWALFIYIGYNVLSAEAKEYHDRDKDEYVGRETPDENYDVESYADDSRQMNKDYCERRTFYDNNEKFCDELEKGETDIVFNDEEDQKQICENNDGKWKKGECKFDNKGTHDEPTFDHDMEEQGLYDGYATRNMDDKDREIENQAYLDSEEVVIEDWKNEVVEEGSDNNEEEESEPEQEEESQEEDE